MFCPSCGTQPSLPDQKFCKVCGTNLVVVSQVLQSSTPQAPPLSPPYPGMMPGVPPTPPSTGFLQNPIPSPMTMPSLSGLPFVEEEAKRQKLRKMGWALMGGGILFGSLISIIGDALREIIGPLGRAIGHLGGLGGLMFVAGLFLVFYVRFILKKPNVPQFIVVQQPMPTPGMTAGLPQPPQMQPQQLPPPPVSSFGPPFSVTEHTTARLEVPYPMSSKDSQ